MMILLYIVIWIYIYREKKVFYNIEGQLRGLQGSNYPKTCALHFQARKYNTLFRQKRAKKNKNKKHTKRPDTRVISRAFDALSAEGRKSSLTELCHR
jgi:hypothetical protein